MVKKQRKKSPKTVHIFTGEEYKIKDPKKSEREINKIIKSGRLNNKQFILISFDQEHAFWDSTPELTFAQILWRIKQLERDLLG